MFYLFVIRVVLQYSQLVWRQCFAANGTVFHKVVYYNDLRRKTLLLQNNPNIPSNRNWFAFPSPLRVGCGHRSQQCTTPVGSRKAFADVG